MRAGIGVEIRERGTAGKTAEVDGGASAGAEETAEADSGANAGAEERSATDGGRATVERGLGWKLRTHGLPRRQASPQYWLGSPFQEAVHGQSKRAHRAQVGVTAASFRAAVGSVDGGSGTVGGSSAGGTSSVVPDMISSRTEAVGAKVWKVSKLAVTAANGRHLSEPGTISRSPLDVAAVGW